ncbi:Formin-like protein 3 [Camellia lanceoleosa]|uniref:Formin-like protein 3 n=1 Tax=Camellia lanceoleosa TaxID=1840588 RepID=A0ACC0GCR3_9ERIC|nr:Formin-like protein 3 [Camellia lanceoleosa]
MPELLDFDKDLVHLEATSKIQLKSLVEEMQAVSKGLEKVEQELTALENDGAISVGFRKATLFEYSGKRVCFFGNANDKDDITINFENNNCTIPTWSVSILPDCYTEVYKTAQVNTQTSNMVMKLNDADEYQESYNLQWTWRISMGQRWAL